MDKCIFCFLSSIVRVANCTLAVSKMFALEEEDGTFPWFTIKQIFLTLLLFG